MVNRVTNVFLFYRLICTVTYGCPSVSSEPTSFRKYFKIQADKPLDVKTKFYNSEVFKYFPDYHVLIFCLLVLFS